MNTKKRFETTSAQLHIMAMIFMLCDHIWATIVPGNDWLNCVGRIAFPIFAFLLVEGYFHTSNLKKYASRLLLFAILSEIPFNLMTGGWFFYPIHQNVMWTLLIGLILVHINEKAKGTGKLAIRIIVGIVTVFLGFFAGLLSFADYNFAGIFTILVFYFFRGKKWWNYLGQFLLLAYINAEVIGGFVYEINMLGNMVYFHRQSFALLALLPIWAYNGKQGYKNKILQSIYYGFYPIHMLILVGISIIF